MATYHSKAIYKFYTYLHIRLTDGLVFYVGKGTRSRISKTEGRNKYWQNTANKHGWKSYIYAHFKNEDDAFENEKELIAFYKGINHPLCNLTDGGEGVSGCIWSDERRENRSVLSTGRKHSEESKKKMSIASKKRGISSEVRMKACLAIKGKKRPAEFGAKISAALKGMPKAVS